MKKVLLALSALTLVAGIAIGSFVAIIPETVPTAVIAEKPVGPVRGNQVAVRVPSNITSEQHHLLQTALQIAKADGHKNPELVQAVLLQETEAGAAKSYRVANPGSSAYFGLMQITLGAARDVLLMHPKMFVKFGFHTKTDDEIKANLILNDTFNIEIGSKYLLMLQRQYGLAGDRLLLAYNRGPNSADLASNTDPHGYVSGAKMKLKAAVGRQLSLPS